MGRGKTWGRITQQEPSQKIEEYLAEKWQNLSTPTLFPKEICLKGPKQSQTANKLKGTCRCYFMCV